MNAISQLLQKGVHFHQVGQLPQAEQSYLEILRLQPNHPDALHLLGVIASQSGKPESALELIQCALAIQPHVPVYHLNLGNTCLDLGRMEEAIDHYRRALELDSGILDGLINLGVALRRQNLLQESESNLRKALEIQPDNASAHFHLGTTLLKIRRYTEACDHFKKALNIKPDHADARRNLGVALRRAGRLTEAEKLYRETLELQPHSAENHVNLSHVLFRCGRFDEALACFNEALRWDPNSGEAHTNRSILRLLQGDYAEGLPEYEWRWHRKNASLPQIPKPFWDGQGMPGKTILLLAEQGTGDLIHFIRYAPLVRQRVGRVLLACRPPFAPILSRCRGIDQIIPEGDPLPHFDVYAPLMSLPHLLGTTLKTIPAKIPYLEADPERIACWRRRLGFFPGLTIGLAWQGNPDCPDDTARSVPLIEWLPLFRVPGIRFISLQKGFGSEQVRTLPWDVPLLDFSGQLDEVDGAFVDTAALICSLDLVITVDTAIVHVAGALGAYTWLALSNAPDWRWLLERPNSPWYPTVRIFRQKIPGNWDDVAQEMAKALSILTPYISSSNDKNEQNISSSLSNRQPLHIPVAAGELYDKITILEIKRKRITDSNKLAYIEKEWKALTTLRDYYFTSSLCLDALTARLEDINSQLWEIEDALRACERQEDFGPRFIELARQVYHLNDNRADLKGKINTLLRSEFVEEKSYMLLGAAEGAARTSSSE